MQIAQISETILTNAKNEAKRTHTLMQKHKNTYDSQNKSKRVQLNTIGSQHWPVGTSFFLSAKI